MHLAVQTTQTKSPEKPRKPTTKPVNNLPASPVNTILTYLFAAVCIASMNPASKTISFRLSSEHYALLEQAGEATQSSPGEVARARLLASFTSESGQGDFDRRLHLIEGFLRDLRHDLPLVARALLLSSAAAGKDKSFTPETAEAWARENLHSTE